MKTFASVGTSREPFLRLLAAIEELVAAGGVRGKVTIQSGHTPFQSSRCEVIPFLSMDQFEEEVRTSSLIICQAGGGTVILARRFGKVPVVVPRRPELGEVVDGHQIANAKALDEAGQAVAVFDTAGLLQAIAKALTLQETPRTKGNTPSLSDAIEDDLSKWAQLAR